MENAENTIQHDCLIAHVLYDNPGNLRLKYQENGRIMPQCLQVQNSCWFPP